MRYPFKIAALFHAVILATAAADSKNALSKPIITPPPMLAATPIGFAVMPLPRFHRRQVASCAA